jgi:Peptidase family M23
MVKRRFLLAMLAVLPLETGPLAAAAVPATPPVRVQAVPGTLVRWTVPGTKRCAMGGRSWVALQETCYYPIDLLQKPGLVQVSRKGVGPAKFAQISVVAASYGTREVDLGDIPQAHPSPADLRRNTRDQAVVAKVWVRREGPARFTLPLGAPGTPLPEGKDFGAKWTIGDDLGPEENHSGADYALAVGSPVAAVADGTVVIAEDLFFTGKAVFIDHGDGLVSMYFHFSELKVQTGQDVKKGEILGLVGSTGRATGPHLHLGVRWHGARINPQALLDDPAKIPAIAP